ncbi:MAG TPA: Gfo/Idh/MocA family oxidoreductase [Terriglobales bacterium]|nr:Gfo/Idh/MocA family oxidoreductase [Terriglobales bacterium]
MTKPVRIAIVGCGAVTERFHLPALQKLGWPAALLVDPNLGRAQMLSERFDANGAAAEFREQLDAFDAAIVAVPHVLHEPVCADLLRRGKHVLVEKPLATTTAECESILAAQTSPRTVLAVGLMRHFWYSLRWVKSLLDSGGLGRVESFDFREGSIYDWPIASDFMFRKEKAGGGALIDVGAHTLDLLLWWLGDVAEVEYYDDDYGGVEADALLELAMASGARGTVEVSRTRMLRNTAILRGTRGTLEIALHANRVRANPPSLLKIATAAGRGSGFAPQGYHDLFVSQLQDWLAAIECSQRPSVSGESAARSVALIERCYRSRRPLKLSWMAPAEPAGVAPE